MASYICKGDCDGVSEVSGVCEKEGCSHFGQQLVECDCDTVDKCKSCCDDGVCNPPQS
jgi:hypothetical protein